MACPLKEGLILKLAHLLENCVGMNDWQCCYIQGRYSYICYTKQGIEVCALWGINWYGRMCNSIRGVAQTEVIITEFNSKKTKNLYIMCMFYCDL
jgi:hypothetical protein